MVFLSESYKNRLKELAGISEEVYPREIANDKFIEKYGDLELISQTQMGALYRKGPGVIVKLTSDKSEYDNAVSFLNKPHKNFIKYYSAEPMEIEGGDDWYVLSMEEISELNDNEWEMIDLVNNTLGLQSYMLDA